MEEKERGESLAGVAREAETYLARKYDSLDVKRIGMQRVMGGGTFAKTVGVVWEATHDALAVKRAAEGLEAIIDWPTAGLISSELRSVVSAAGGDTGLVVELFGLVKKITVELPFGERTKRFLFVNARPLVRHPAEENAKAVVSAVKRFAEGRLLV